MMPRNSKANVLFFRSLWCFVIITCSTFVPNNLIAAAGALDTTFGSGTGYVFTQFGNSNRGMGAVLQSDGKIIALGDVKNGSVFNVGLTRHLTNGQLDATFGVEGKVTLSFGSSVDIPAIALQNDGKIVVSCGFPTSIIIARLNSDGSYDTGFDFDGKVIIPLLRTQDASGMVAAHNLVVQPDGKIVSAWSRGRSDSSGSSFAIFRHNADGSLDSTFGAAGMSDVKIGPRFDIARAVALQPDGKIVVAGHAENDSIRYAAAVIRLNSDGGLDSSFSGDGIARNFGPSGQAYASSIALQNDGRILVGGMAANPFAADFALWRFLPDGSLDASFGGAGIVLTGFELDVGDRISQTIIQPDGRIVVGGVTRVGTPDNFALARYNPDGSLDTSFNSSGRVTTSFGNSSRLGSIVQQPDGNIVAVGYATSSTPGQLQFVLARYLGLSEIEIWRLSFFGSAANTGNSADAFDFDGDGFTNLQEFSAGTSPSNSADFFKIQNPVRSAGNFSVSTAGKSGRTYVLERSANLSFWISVATQGPLSGDGSVLLVDTDSPNEAAFYRIRVTGP